MVDFSNRSAAPQDVAPGAQRAPASTPSKKRRLGKGKLGRFAFVGGAVIVAILLIAVIILAMFGGKSDEDKYVNNDKLQAVFLNTGQVYFGNIKDLNGKYLTLTNIYYLQTAQTGSTGTTASAGSNVTLVKLGCELHEPYDQMVINRDQVTFWENLQDNGKVATAVSTFEKQNPNGQKCADQSSAAGTDSVNSTQNAGTSNSSNSSTTNP